MFVGRESNTNIYLNDESDGIRLVLLEKEISFMSNIIELHVINYMEFYEDNFISSKSLIRLNSLTLHKNLINQRLFWKENKFL